MSLAARWLEDDAKSIGQISAELGYSGVPAFSRAFKDRFGEPPSDYRARAGSQRTR
jgi:AraC-like DNA-binding protein